MISLFGDQNRQIKTLTFSGTMGFCRCIHKSKRARKLDRSFVTGIEERSVNVIASAGQSTSATESLRIERRVKIFTDTQGKTLLYDGSKNNGTEGKPAIGAYQKERVDDRIYQAH